MGGATKNKRVPPYSTLFGGTHNSDKEYLISSINEFVLKDQQYHFFLRNIFWSFDDNLLCELSKKNVTKSENSPKGEGISAKNP